MFSVVCFQINKKNKKAKHVDNMQLISKWELNERYENAFFFNQCVKLCFVDTEPQYNSPITDYKDNVF